MSLAVITGASRGFGAALSEVLIGNGWDVIGTGRRKAHLDAVATRLGSAFTPVVGDISDPVHRNAIVELVTERRGLALVVNNASSLGESPLPSLLAISSDTLRRVFDINSIAPLLLTQRLIPAMQAGIGVVVNMSSDAAVEAYPGWGGYGASKAALDHMTSVLATEAEKISVYAFDPGDMRTEMHQAAFPGEDISDRPLPETVVPAFMELLESRPPSGRYRARDSRLATL